jgi:hypothetical protein
MIVIVNKWWMKWVASIAYRLKGSDQVYAAQSLFIFIILREKEFENCERLIHHEKIHFWQQVEMLFIFHWLLYLAFYLFNLIRYQSHQKAYRLNPFEKEAYQNDGDFSYLHHRKPYAWVKYIRLKASLI